MRFRRSHCLKWTLTKARNGSPTNAPALLAASASRRDQAPGAKASDDAPTGLQPPVELSAAVNLLPFAPLIQHPATHCVNREVSGFLASDAAT